MEPITFISIAVSSIWLMNIVSFIHNDNRFNQIERQLSERQLSERITTRIGSRINTREYSIY